MDQSTIKVANYCVAFFDLLGQRAALGSDVLLPSDARSEEFADTVRKSVGAISFLQEIAQDMLDSLQPTGESELKNTLPVEAHPHWEAMEKNNVMLQRWSDGLVIFSCLGDEEIKCNLIGVFQLFIVAGGVMFLTLAAGKPVRGAIEIAWGAELHPGELYGNAIAEAYRLENQDAKFPRIVLGKEIVGYLGEVAHATATDVYAQLDARIAKKCLAMIEKEGEGHFFLDYLGSGYQEASPIPQFEWKILYDHLVSFAKTQLVKHRASGNDSLEKKYQRLLDYINTKACGSKAEGV